MSDNCFSKTVFLVTGAFGHLGNTIVNMLASQFSDSTDIKIRGLALENDNSLQFSNKNVQIFRGNICDKSSLIPFFSNTNGSDIIVIHTAGIVSIATKFDQKVFDVNVTGTKNMVDTAIEFGAKRFVHVSSVHAIPELPNNAVITEKNHFSPDDVHGLYAKTKAEATQYVLDSVNRGLSASVVFPSGIIGEGDYGKGHITQLIIDYLNGSLVAGVDGGYDFVDVRDVALGILSCAKNGGIGESYILSNRYVSIPELLHLLHTISGKPPVRTILPYWLARFTAPLSELYYKLKKQPPLYTSYSLFTLNGNGRFSHHKASVQLSYHPRDIVATLTDTVQWLTLHKRVK